MNWIDIVIVAMLGLNIFNGLRRGFILSLFDILAIVLAVIFSIKYYHFGIELLTDTFRLSEPIAYILSFALTWVAIYCVISLVGAILHKFLAFSFLRPLDIFGGAAFGLVKGLIFAIIIFIPMTYVPFLPTGLSTSLQDSIIIEWAKPSISERLPGLDLSKQNFKLNILEENKILFK
ncbi:MAG: CvpA family protein [Candidatus Margulisbacteria bacterium]|nr:CvpA family protein [Candidatus Margulisiibacteriota bacterium]